MQKGKIMGNTYFERVHEQTPTRFWINNVTRKQAQLAIDHGAVGCTQNPAYTWKMITNEEEKDYVDGIISNIIKNEDDDNMALVALQRELIGGVARVFHPLFERSCGKQGYVSIQGDPFNEKKEAIIDYAHFNREGGENMMCKIPAVPDGLAAIEELIRQNVPINATECMAIRQVLDVCELYEKTTKNMINPAPLYFSLITGIFDECVANEVKEQNIDIYSDKLWLGGLAVAKKCYEIIKKRGYKAGWISGGARGLHHFTEMVGGDCVITINWKGTADKLIDENPPVVSRFFNPVDQDIIDELTEKIPTFKKAFCINGITPDEYEDYSPVVLFRRSFEDAWENARSHIASLRNRS